MTPGSLSPSGEEAWRSLSQHAEWATGSWIGWIFTDRIASGFELHQRLARQLAAVGCRSDWWLPRDPEQVEAALRWLLGGADGADGCVWLAWPEWAGPWAQSWSELLNRLNERREVLRRALRGGLVFVVPLVLKEATRSGAPDLWSIRSFALDVKGGAGDDLPVPPRGVVGPLFPGALRDRTAGRDLVLAEQAVGLARSGGNLEAEVRALNQLALVLLRMDRPANARQVNNRALAIAEVGDLRAETLAVDGLIHQALGDRERAIEVWRESWALAGSQARASLGRHLIPALHREGVWDLLKAVVSDAMVLPGASTDLLYYMAEGIEADGLGDLEAARDYYEKFSSSDRVGDQILGDHSVWVQSVAQAQLKLARIYGARGDLLKVVEVLTHRNERLVRCHDESPDDPLISLSLLVGTLPLVAVLGLEQREVEAETSVRRALKIAQERPGMLSLDNEAREVAARWLDGLTAYADPASAAALRAEAAALRAA